MGRIGVVGAAVAMVGLMLGGGADAQERPPEGVPVLLYPGAPIAGSVSVIPADGPAYLFSVDPLGFHTIVSLSDHIVVDPWRAGAIGPVAPIRILKPLMSGSTYPWICTVHPNMTGSFLAV